MRRHFRWSCLKRTGYCCFRSASRTTFERCVGTREERLSVRRPEPRSVRTRICRDRRAFGKLAVRTTSLTPYEITREAGAIGDSVSGKFNANPYRRSRCNRLDRNLCFICRHPRYHPASFIPRENKLRQQSACFALVDRHLAVRGLSAQSADRERLACAGSIEMQGVAQEHQIRAHESISISKRAHRRGGAVMPMMKPQRSCELLLKRKNCIGGGYRGSAHTRALALQRFASLALSALSGLMASGVSRSLQKRTF